MIGNRSDSALQTPLLKRDGSSRTGSDSSAPSLHQINCTSSAPSNEPSLPSESMAQAGGTAWNEPARDQAPSLALDTTRPRSWLSYGCGALGELSCPVTMVAVFLVAVLLPSFATMVLLVAWNVLLIMRAYGKTTATRGPRLVIYFLVGYRPHHIMRRHLLHCRETCATSALGVAGIFARMFWYSLSSMRWKTALSETRCGTAPLP